MEYRAISLHQPWASLVALGIKQYETRGWATKFRGKLLICSTQKYPLSVGLLKDAGLIWSEYPRLYDDDITDAMEVQKELVERLGWTYVSGEYATSAMIFDHVKPSRLFHKGCILCVADLTDCYLMTTDGKNVKAEGREVSQLEQLCGNWEAGRYAWNLSNVKPLPDPIPVKGKQGLWIPDKSIIQKIESQLNNN